MQIYKIIGNGKNSKWEKSEFLQFPEDCKKKPLLNAIISHIEENDKRSIGIHWIVFSEEEEKALLDSVKIFVVTSDTILVFLEMLCGLLREQRIDAPFATYVSEDSPDLKINSNFRLALKFGRR